MSNTTTLTPPSTSSITSSISTIPTPSIDDLANHISQYPPLLRRLSTPETPTNLSRMSVYDVIHRYNVILKNNPNYLRQFDGLDPTVLDVYQFEQNKMAETHFLMKRTLDRMDTIMKLALEEVDNTFYASLEMFEAQLAALDPQAVASTMSEISPPTVYTLGPGAPTAPEFPTRGGHEDPTKNQEVVNELDYHEPDSQHDFNATRQTFFPSRAKGKPSGEASRMVLDVLNKILEDAPPGQSAPLLAKYYTNSASAFESNIKVDYLLGDIAGKIDDISYYFSDKEVVAKLTATGDKEAKQTYFSTITMDPINKLFLDIKKLGIEYWLFDAVGSSRVKNNINQQAEEGRYITLANMWDPSKLSNPLFQDITEQVLASQSNTSILVQQPVSPTLMSEPGYTIWDWQRTVDENGNRIAEPVSLYDEIYYPLLNQDQLRTTYAINIQIRLAKPDIPTNPVQVALCIFKGGTLLKVFILKEGFSVDILAKAMTLIELGFPADLQAKYTAAFTKNELQKGFKTLMELVLLIQYNTFGDPRPGNKPDTWVNDQYIKLLLRFKSSGDHGQAKMVKVINKYLKKTVGGVFVSGDNLAYVYSIAGEIPTIAQYYGAKKEQDTKEEADEDDDGEDVTAVASDIVEVGKQYYIGYFPMKESQEKYVQYMNRRISVLGTIYGTLVGSTDVYRNPNYADPPTVQRLVSPEEIQNFVEGLNALRSVVINQNLLPIFRTYIQTNIAAATPEQTQQWLRDTITQGFLLNNTSILTMLEWVPPNIDRLMSNIPGEEYQEFRRFLGELDTLTDNIYYVQYYHRIQQIIRDNVRMVLGKMTKILALDVRSIQQIMDGTYTPSSRSGTALSQYTNQLVTNFNRTYGKSMVTTTPEKYNEMKQKFMEMMAATLTEKKTKTLQDDYRTTLAMVKESRSLLTKSIESDLNIASSKMAAVFSRNISMIRNVYIERIRALFAGIRDKNVGAFLTEYFDKALSTQLESEPPVPEPPSPFTVTETPAQAIGQITFDTMATGLESIGAPRPPSTTGVSPTEISPLSESPEMKRARLAEAAELRAATAPSLVAPSESRKRMRIETAPTPYDVAQRSTRRRLVLPESVYRAQGGNRGSRRRRKIKTLKPRKMGKCRGKSTANRHTKRNPGNKNK